MAKQPYTKGTNGSKPTPMQVPNKPLPAYVQTTDLSLFKAPGSKANITSGGPKSRAKK